MPVPARPRPLVAGNWKMNGLRSALKELTAMAEGYDAGLRARVDLLVCPPATLLYVASAAAIVRWTGASRPRSADSRATPPDSQGSSSRLPRSRSCSIDAFMPAGSVSSTPSGRLDPSSVSCHELAVAPRSSRMR